MDPRAFETTVSRMADYLGARNDAQALASDSFGQDIGQLSRASIDFINEVAARISLRQTTHEARLADLVERLDAEDKRGKQLEERISQATSAVVEAELWVARVTDAIKSRLSNGCGAESGTAAAA
jgi:hypothetical protein